MQSSTSIARPALTLVAAAAILFTALLYVQKYSEFSLQLPLPFIQPDTKMGGGSGEGYRTVAYFVNW